MNGLRDDHLKAALAGLGDDSPKRVYRLKRAVREMRRVGRATAGELLLFTEAGIPVWQYVADGRGIKTVDVMWLVAGGLIPADEAVAAIGVGLRRDYA